MADTVTALDIVKQLYAAYGEKSVDKMVSLVTDDVKWNCHMQEEQSPIAGNHVGREGVRTCLLKDFAGVDCYSFSPKEFFAYGNHVTVMGAGFYEVKKTGKMYSGIWSHFFTITNGKVSRLEMFANISNAGETRR